MTQLPATFVEADALAFARDWVAWARRDPEGIFHPNATTVYGTSAMKSWAKSKVIPFGDDDILYFAENGSKEAHLALVELIDECNDRGEPLTPVLTAYNKRLINPWRKPRRPGPGRAENFIRDFGITMLVIHLMERFGLRPTQRTNRKAKLHPPSASSIAATALTEAGINIPLGFKGVEKIFARYLPALAGTKFAEGTKFAAGYPPGYQYPGLFGTVLRVPSLT
jgi:hypothetical protein